MSNASRSSREEFVAALVKHAPSATIWYARRIMRYSATYGRLQETECNRELTPAERNKEARVRDAIVSLCRDIRCKVVFQGDPRGNTVKIVVPDGYTNDWGREGICVPTS